MLISALTVAGSDPSGGAGIQSDLRTFSSCGVYGISVIASLTAQNTQGITATMNVPAAFIAQQLDAVFSDLRVDAAKTGMLGNAASVEIIAEKFLAYGTKNIVVDPVMVSSSGTTLLEPFAIETIKRRLIPLALVVTPNLHEAEILSESEIRDTAAMEAAARRIHGMGARFVLVKGGHLAGDAVDVLYDGKKFFHLRENRIGSGEVHGTGCALSAAIAAHLAQSDPVIEAVQKAKEFVTRAIANSVSLGHGNRLIFETGN